MAAGDGAAVWAPSWQKIEIAVLGHLALVVSVPISDEHFATALAHLLHESDARSERDRSHW